MWQPHTPRHIGTRLKPIFDQGDKAAKVHGVTRSREWPQVELAHRTKFPNCACCATGTNLTSPINVHHIIPFHFVILLGRPDLELDQRNLLTLCEADRFHSAPNHHLLVGHFDDWQSFNYSVANDCLERFHGMSEPQIRIMAEWRSLCASRPSHWEHMTDEQKETLKKYVDSNFPLPLTPA
jgi:hypothetical protein